MDGTRPVTRQLGQAQTGDIALIDGNHGDLGGWFDGTTDLEQPVKADVFLEIQAQRGNSKDDTEESGDGTDDETLCPARQTFAAPAHPVSLNGK